MSFEHIDENWMLDHTKVILEHGGDVRVQDPSMGINFVSHSVEAILLREILMELRAIRKHTIRMSERSSIV
jgi:hypothetical protein